MVMRSISMFKEEDNGRPEVNLHSYPKYLGKILFITVLCLIILLSLPV